MANKKNTEFVTQIGNLRKPPLTIPAKPFDPNYKTPALGYKNQDGNFIPTPTTTAKTKIKK